MEKDIQCHRPNSKGGKILRKAFGVRDLHCANCPTFLGEAGGRPCHPERCGAWIKELKSRWNNWLREKGCQD